MSVNLKRIFCTAASCAWVLFIWWNSFQTGAVSGGISRQASLAVSDMLSWFRLEIPVDTLEFFLRKAAHASEFFILAVFISAAFYYNKKRGVRLGTAVLLLTLLTAVCDEFIQSFIPGRGSSVRDVVLDFMGALAGLFICLLLILLREKRRKAPPRGRGEA